MFENLVFSQPDESEIDSLVRINGTEDRLVYDRDFMGSGSLVKHDGEIFVLTAGHVGAMDLAEDKGYIEYWDGDEIAQLTKYYEDDVYLHPQYLDSGTDTWADVSLIRLPNLNYDILESKGIDVDDLFEIPTDGMDGVEEIEIFGGSVIRGNFFESFETTEFLERNRAIVFEGDLTVKGDSGGPIVYEEGDKHYIGGIISVGENEVTNILFGSPIGGAVNIDYVDDFIFDVFENGQEAKHLDVDEVVKAERISDLKVDALLGTIGLGILGGTALSIYGLSRLGEDLRSRKDSRKYI